MFSVFKQWNLQIPTHSPIQISFGWLNHQVHQWSWLNCKPIHLVIHPNSLWSHTSERGSDHFWWNGFLLLRNLQNLQTDQFLRSLFLSFSKFMNSISHPLLSDSMSKRFVQRYIEWLEKGSSCLKEAFYSICHMSFKWVVNKQALSL